MVEVSSESMGMPTSSNVVHPSGCPAPRGVPPMGSTAAYQRGAKRANTKSVIAAAIYAANQNESGKTGASVGLQQQQQQPPLRPSGADRPPRGAPPGYGGANPRTKIVSAFGQGDSSSWTGVSAAELAAGFDNSGGGVQVSVPIDLTTQSSMVHRMMDREKNDVDPRDVHKLLPETMMASDSLDLHSELIQGKINQVIHDIMDSQAVQNMDAPGAQRARRIPTVEDDAHHYADAQVSQLTRMMPSVELGSIDLGMGQGGVGSPECISPVHAIPSSRASMRLSPTPPHLPPRPRSVQGLRSTYSAPSPVPGNPPAAAPVTGYPAASALGVVHPLNQGRMSPIAPSRAQSPTMVRRTAIPDRNGQLSEAALQLPGTRYAVMNPAAAPVVTVGTIPVQYMQYSQGGLGKFVNADVRSASRLSCPSPISEPVLGSPLGDDHPNAVFAITPDPRGAMTPIPGQRLSGNGALDLVNPDLDPNAPDDGKGKGARKFRSLEAALAWCHVQHSQKHVPVVPKDDVKKLVEFQLKNGKPIRAPWYRPTRSEDSEDEEGDDAEDRSPEGSELSFASRGEQSLGNSNKTNQDCIPETEEYKGDLRPQAPPMEHTVQRIIKPSHRPHPSRPERPRCESAPLVRSWKQSPSKSSHPRSRPASQAGNAKPLGTGFFCPPGFEFPAASPTAH